VEENIREIDGTDEFVGTNTQKTNDSVVLQVLSTEIYFTWGKVNKKTGAPEIYTFTTDNATVIM